VDQKESIEAVRHWVESFVVELNLCPFAQRELQAERVRFCLSEADSSEALLERLLEELELLESDAEIETTLLIHPQVLQDFDDYNQFLDLVDALLEQEGYAGVYQVASFHPDYQFADTTAGDAQNYSNRSPFPLLHLLREASVERAVASYPAVDEIPARNIERLRQLGVERLQSMLRGTS